MTVKSFQNSKEKIILIDNLIETFNVVIVRYYMPIWEEAFYLFVIFLS